MIQFKNEKVKSGWSQLKEKLKVAIIEMDEWVQSQYKKDIVLVETISTLEDDLILCRVSSSHRECRAVDIRIKDWPQTMIDAFIKHFTYLDEKIGAVSSEDKIRRFIVYKPHGTGPHFHLQIGRDIK
jgi:hypothetical protein